MPHQCVHCGKIYPEAAKELLAGCSCGSHFFFYIKEKQFESLKDKKILPELDQEDKKQIEKDVREMIGVEEEEAPVILDLESVKVVGPGRYQLDVVNLFRRGQPIVYKLQEGKYIIDLASTVRVGMDKIGEKIKKPEEK
ncbi:MAG: Zn-ribbon containing protein [archaeon]